MDNMDKYRDALAEMFGDKRFREFRKFCYFGSVDGAKIGVVVASKTPKYDNFALNKREDDREQARRQGDRSLHGRS